MTKFDRISADLAFSDAQKRCIENALTYALSLWGCIPHATKAIASEKFSMALTAMEKQGIERSKEFPYDDFAIIEYLPNAMFPYDTLTDMFGSLFADTAYDALFERIEDYGNNVLLFPNPDEIKD